MDSKEFLALFKGSHHFCAGDDLKREGNKWQEGAKAENLQELNKNKYGVYFTVNKFEPHTRKKETIKRVRAIYIDDDVSGKLIKKWPLEPSIIVQTSKNKYNYYWLTNTTDFPTYELIQQTLVDEYNGDKNARDISRVLRIPGYYHCKGRRIKVKVIGGNLKRYRWNVIKVAFPPAESKTSSFSSEDKDFETSEATMQFVNGENFHGSMLSLAMSKANRGWTKPDFENYMLGLYVQAQAKITDVGRLKELEDRMSNEHINECWDSAEKRVDGEGRLSENRVSISDKKTVTTGKMKRPPKIKDSLIFPDDEYGRFVHDVYMTTKHTRNKVAAMVHANSMVRFAADGYATKGADICSGINVVVGNTFCGKSLSLKAAKEYLPNEALYRVVGKSGSGEGLEDAFISHKERPSIAMFPDEFGFMLEGIKTSKIGGGIISMILEYITNGLSVIATRSLAGKEHELLYAPRLTISGNTTSEALVGGVTKSDVETGLVNRMCFFYAEESSEIVEINHKPNQDFKLRMLEIVELSDISADERQLGFRNVRFNVAARGAILKKRKELTKPNNPLSTNIRGRHVEVAKTFALARAIFIAPKKPVVSLEIWEWAFEMVEFAMKSIEYLFENYLSSQNEFASAEQKLVNRLNDNSGEMNKGEAFNFHPYVQWDVGTKSRFRKNLIDEDIIEVFEKRRASGRVELKVRLIGEL